MTEWRLEGSERISDQQRKMLNALCGCLASQIVWHGQKLSKDDWRHMAAGTVRGWRLTQGIDTGNGPGLIYLGASSMTLTRSQASEAITMLLQIGDHPDEQGLSCTPVVWSDAVLLGLGYNPSELR